MLILAIIIGLIALAMGIVGIVRYNQTDGYSGEGWGVGFIVLGLIWLIPFFSSLNLSFSTKTLTGYIYSADTAYGYTTGHIRFSEQAGLDVQPSFCVKADSEAGQQIKELAGSGKKVKINIPPYFYFANNPFACGTTAMKIELVE